jgi:hypothetical protein
MTPTEYEEAVLEHFRADWPPPKFVVKHNIRLLGRKSNVQRQIDVSIFEKGKRKPLLIVEVKMHRRRIDLTSAGATIALVQDVGGAPAIMVSTSGFSVAAKSHLASEGIASFIITLKDAHALRWIPLIEKKFSVDRKSKKVSGHLVEALRMGDVSPFLGSAVPYEEWRAVVACGLERFPKSTVAILKAMACIHSYDGVRFNAVQILDEAGRLSLSDVEDFLQSEYDPDILEQLHGLLTERVATGE